MPKYPLPEWDDGHLHVGIRTALDSAGRQEVVKELRRQLKQIPVSSAAKRFYYAGLMAAAGIVIGMMTELSTLASRSFCAVLLGMAALVAFVRLGRLNSSTRALVRRLAIRNLLEKQLLLVTIEARNSAELLGLAMQGRQAPIGSRQATAFTSSVDRFRYLADNYAQICYNRGLNFESSEFMFEQDPGLGSSSRTDNSDFNAIVIQALIDILDGSVGYGGEESHDG
ncbi:hypothetical protein KDL44_08315 [bacterium]|nr:hypothetical protein [bacterium]